MPFTAAHPAVVLPLKKVFKHLYLPAAIIGSVAPDFEYFFRLRTIGTLGHTWLGVFIFDLPVVVLVWLMYEYIVKPKLIPHLPKPFDSAYQPSLKPAQSYRSFYFVAAFILSAIIGILSHVIWDGFTHLNGFFVKHSIFLQSYFNFFGYNWSVYNFLQHFFSIVGMAFEVFIFWWYGRQSVPMYNSLSSKKKWYFWLSWIVLSILIFAGFYFAAHSLTVYLGSLIVFVINSTLLSLVLVSLAWPKHVKQ